MLDTKFGVSGVKTDILGFLIIVIFSIAGRYFHSGDIKRAEYKDNCSSRKIAYFSKQVIEPSSKN